jgi:hypothetical protein
MSAILNMPVTEFEPRLERVEHVVLVAQRVETFESVGTPEVGNLGASLVEEFAHDLRRLADA